MIERKRFCRKKNEIIFCHTKYSTLTSELYESIH